MSTRQPLRTHLILGLVWSLAAVLVLWWLLGARNTTWHWLVSGLGAVNLVTFFYYGYDKRQARQGGSRVPEAALHVLSLAGGSLGAALAMAWFRHKTMKGSFRILFGCILLLQAAALGWLAKASWWP